MVRDSAMETNIAFSNGAIGDLYDLPFLPPPQLEVLMHTSDATFRQTTLYLVVIVSTQHRP